MSDSNTSPIQLRRYNPKNSKKNQTCKEACECQKEMNEFRDAMESKLGQMQEQMKLIVEALAEQKVLLKNMSTQGHGLQRDTNIFPIKSIEELASINSKICNDNRKVYVNTITSLITPQGVKKNMKFVLAPQLTNLINIDGIHGKESLRKMKNFFDVFIEAIIPNACDGGPENQLREAIRLQKKRYLKKIADSKI